jgi:hypothetical protein
MLVCLESQVNHPALLPSVMVAMVVKEAPGAMAAPAAEEETVPGISMPTLLLLILNTYPSSIWADPMARAVQLEI